MASLFWVRPLPMNFLSLLPGTNDLWLQVWNQWWMGKALFDLGQSPMNCDFMFYPVGVNLFYHALSPFNSLVAAIVAPATGPVSAFNLLFFLTFWLSGYGAFLCARQLGCGMLGAYCAGYIYAFSPYHFLHQRQLEHMAIQWLPFILFFLLRAKEKGLWRDAFAAGVFFAVNFYSNIYYGLFAGILAGIVFLYDSAGARNDARQFVIRWAVFAASAGALIAPYLFKMVSASGQAGRFKVPLYVNVHQSIDLLAFVTPSPQNPLLRDWFPTMHLYEKFTGWEPIGYLGFSVIALALYGLLCGLGSRRVFLAVVAGIFLVLALGPVLHIAGIYTLSDGNPVILPQAFLQVLPMISAARVPARYLAVAMLPIAVLAGMGLSRIEAQSPRRRRPLVLAVLLSLIVVEYWNEPLETSAAVVPRFCEIIREDPEDVTVLDLPIRVSSDSAEWWRATDPDTRGWYQANHEKRTLIGPASHTALRRENFLFFLESPLLGPLVSDGPVGLPSDGAARQELDRLRIRYVVFHRYLYDRLPPADLDRDVRLVEGLEGFERIHEDNDVILMARRGD